MRKQIFQFEFLIPDKPIKIQDARKKKKKKKKKIKMTARLLKYSNIFTKSTLKCEFKVVIFTGCLLVSKTIQTGRQKSKMAATKLKIWQNSQIHTLKL